MSKKYRNPKTGETFILEEEDEESTLKATKKVAPSDGRESSDDVETETAENDEPDSEEDDGENTGKGPFGVFRTPFDFLDEIDGKDVEKVVLGAVLGIGGVLAINGLCSFLRRA